MNDPIFSHKKGFLSYTACNEWPLTFAYICLQKYYFNIQWHNEKKIQTLYSKLLEYNQI